MKLIDTRTVEHKSLVIKLNSQRITIGELKRLQILGLDRLKKTGILIK